MSGMSALTGVALDDDAHIHQSIRDILTTPVGSRIMRREYGSLIPELIDHPGNAANRLRLMAASVMALLRWEKRITVNSTSISITEDGKVTIDINATSRSGPRAGNKINFQIAIK